MSDSPVDILEQAIALYRAPSQLSRLLGRPLGDTLLLLRIAADDRAAIAIAMQATGETAETVTDAALLYIQQVLFADTADAYRLLGARPDDAIAQIKDHHRWLIRWLHPDRQPERWEVAYSDRVNQAWQMLRSPERREAYDLSLQSNAPMDVRERHLPMRARAAGEPTKPLLSPEIKRRLPQFILGGLGIGACMVLGLLYYLQEEAPVSAQVATDKLASSPSHSTPKVAVFANAAVPVHVIAAPIEPVRVAATMPDQTPLLAMALHKESRSLPVAAEMDSSMPATQNVMHPPSTTRSETAALAMPMQRTKPPDAVASSDAETNRQRLREQSKSMPVAITAVMQADAAATPVPVAVLAPAKPVAPPAMRLPQEAVSVLVASFTRAYASGDLQTMMGLFTVDAVNNRGGVEAIATDYDKLFRDTQSRELRLERLAWTTSEDRIVGSGPFEANIQRNGESLAQHVDGWITIEARLIDGHWRIQRIIHRNAQ